MAKQAKTVLGQIVGLAVRHDALTQNPVRETSPISTGRAAPRQQVVVLVSSDGINQSGRPWLLGAPVAGEDPADILAIAVPGHGLADAGQISRFYRRWLAERLDVLDTDTLDQLAFALRAALDL